jgi:hypothetical protein
MINHGKQILIFLFFGVFLLVLTSVVVVSVPSIRYYIGNFLLSYQDFPSKPQTLTADAISALNKNAIPVPSPVASIQDDYSQASKPKTYEYKLLKSVDICQMNALGADGFQSIEYGGTMDTSSGRDADCKNYHTVNVLDWVLFMKEK